MESTESTPPETADDSAPTNASGKKRKTRFKKNRDLDDAHAEAHQAAMEAMSSKSPSEREALIVTRFNAWDSAKAELTKQRSETRTNIERARENLKENMEQGHAPNDDQAALQKLHRIEVAWQDLDEAKAAAKDLIGAARDHVKTTFDLLQEAIHGSAQLGLFDEAGNKKTDLFDD